MPKPTFLELSVLAFMVVLIYLNYTRRNYPVMFIITLMLIKELVDLKKQG